MAAGRKLVGASNIGGMKETQEMLDFCGKHNITADIELIKMDQIDNALERLAKSDVRYRFVIDVANSLPKIWDQSIWLSAYPKMTKWSLVWWQTILNIEIWEIRIWYLMSSLQLMHLIFSLALRVANKVALVSLDVWFCTMTMTASRKIYSVFALFNSLIGSKSLALCPIWLLGLAFSWLFEW